MNTRDFELPPLPPLRITPDVEPIDYPEVVKALMDYARATVEADRERRVMMNNKEHYDLTAAFDHQQEEAEYEYEYEVWQDGVLQACGREIDYASAKSEADHYAMMYTQDGPVEVRIYEKRLLSVVHQPASTQPQPKRPQPKRHLYNASGSLSEYGIFPECDVQQPTEG